jgi:hypothetical protein
VSGVGEILGAEVGGRLVDGERQQQLGVGGGERESAGAAGGVAEEVEAVEPPAIGEGDDPLDLGVDRVPGRRPVSRVHLQVLGERVDAVEVLEQRSVAHGRGCDDAGRRMTFGTESGLSRRRPHQAHD